MDSRDIFTGILYHLPDSVRYITNETKRIHRLFYDFKEIHPELFTAFEFIDDERTPHSPTLDEIIESFILDGALWHELSNKYVYGVQRSFFKQNYETRIIPEIDETTNDELAKLAEHFNEVASRTL